MKAPSPRRRRAASHLPAPAKPITGRLDATVLDRVLSKAWASTERVDINENHFIAVNDSRHVGCVPLIPMGIRLRDDIHAWLTENDIIYGVHCDLVSEAFEEPWLDAYLIIPNKDERLLFKLRL